MKNPSQSGTYFIKEKCQKGLSHPQNSLLACDEKISKLKKQLTESRNSKSRIDQFQSQFQSRFKQNSFQRMKHQIQQLQNISVDFNAPCDNISSASNGRISVTNLSSNSCVGNNSRIRAAQQSNERTNPEAILQNVNEAKKNPIIYKLKKMISEPNEYFQTESPRHPMHRELSTSNANSKSFTNLRPNGVQDQQNTRSLAKDESSNSCYIKPLDRTNFASSNALQLLPQSNKASTSQQPKLMNLHKKTQSMLVKKAESQTMTNPNVHQKVLTQNEKVAQLSQQLKFLERSIEGIKMEQLHNQKTSQSQQEFGKMMISQKLGKSLVQAKRDLHGLTKRLANLDEGSDYHIVPKALSECLSSIFESLFDIQEVACIQVVLEMLVKNNELTLSLEKQKETLESIISESNSKAKQLRDELEIERRKNQTFINPLPRHQEIDKVPDQELREFASQLYDKMTMISEKESKLIKLVLAIKQSGVDIEKIYNEEVLNDEEDVQSYHTHRPKSILDLGDKSAFSWNMADHSIINDSEESSSSYFHQQINESILESLKRGISNYEKGQNITNFKKGNGAQMKIRLDLSKIKSQQ